MKKIVSMVVLASLLVAGIYVAVSWADGAVCKVDVRNGTNHAFSNVSVRYKSGGQAMTATFNLAVRAKKSFNVDKSGTSVFYAVYNGKTKSVTCNSGFKVIALTD